MPSTIEKNILLKKGKKKKRNFGSDLQCNAVQLLFGIRKVYIIHNILYEKESQNCMYFLFGYPWGVRQGLKQKQEPKTKLCTFT